MVSWTRLSVTLFVRCMSCYYNEEQFNEMFMRGFGMYLALDRFQYRVVLNTVMNLWFQTGRTVLGRLSCFSYHKVGTAEVDRSARAGNCREREMLEQVTGFWYAVRPSDLRFLLLSCTGIVIFFIREEQNYRAGGDASLVYKSKWRSLERILKETVLAQSR